LIAVDTNLLVYSVMAASRHHETARECIAGLAESGERWAIPNHCLIEFAGVTTHPRIYSPALTIEEVHQAIGAWRESPSLVLIGETGTFWTEFEMMTRLGGVRGAMVHDARIAATCRAHGVRELWSADRDFSRYPGLTVRNPLVGRR
jgi:toxin-antitoxin system PIN domain toxin